MHAALLPPVSSSVSVFVLFQTNGKSGGVQAGSLSATTDSLEEMMVCVSPMRPGRCVTPRPLPQSPPTGRAEATASLCVQAMTWLV